MGQLSFKLPDSDFEFIKFISEKNNLPMSVIYRNITLESFQQWKINYLIKETLRGMITIKQFSYMADISINEAMRLIEESNDEVEDSKHFIEYTSSMIGNIPEKELYKHRTGQKKTRDHQKLEQDTD